MANELVPYEQRIGALTVQDVRAQVNLIQHVMREVMQGPSKEHPEGIHYGVIPGTPKPTLYKAGAEKLCLTFRLDPQYESVERYEGVHLKVKSKCTLHHILTGQRLGSGEGNCSTLESRYAYRTASRKCPHCHAEAIIKGKDFKNDGLPTGWLCFAKKGGCGAKFLDGDKAIEGQSIGRVPNEDIADQYNTVLKMADKRSLIAAVLNVTAASDIFTQDIEDMPQFSAAKDMGAAEVVHEAKPFTDHAEDRELVLEQKCKEAGISPKFYLNRLGVESAKDIGADDWTGIMANLADRIAKKAKAA